jgi:hypothetical protein
MSCLYLPKCVQAGRFHKTCKAIVNTVVLIRVKENDFIFGGFTGDAAWNSNGGHTMFSSTATGPGAGMLLQPWLIYHLRPGLRRHARSPTHSSRARVTTGRWASWRCSRWRRAGRRRAGRGKGAGEAPARGARAGRGGEVRRGGGGCAGATRRGGQEAGPPRRVERAGGSAAKPMEAAFNEARRGSKVVHTYLINFSV